jgi:hypothetical protein
MRRCRKIKYESKKQAETALVDITIRRVVYSKDNAMLKIVKCDQCFSWHLSP